MLFVTTVFSGALAFFFTIMLNSETEKLIKKITPFLKEKEKKLIYGPWWKISSLEKQYFLIKIHERFNNNILPMKKFKKLFWARNFFFIFLLMILIYYEFYSRPT